MKGTIRSHLSVLTLVLTAASPVFAAPAATTTALLRLALHSDTRDRYVHLKIGPTFLGRLYRGQTKKIRVRCGAPIPIALYRLKRKLLFTINPLPQTTNQIIAGLPAITTNAYNGSTTLRISGLSRELLRINGKPPGEWPQPEKNSLLLPAGRCTIEAQKNRNHLLWIRHLRSGATNTAALSF